MSPYRGATQPMEHWATVANLYSIIHPMAPLANGILQTGSVLSHVLNAVTDHCSNSLLFPQSGADTRGRSLTTSRLA